MGTIFTYERIMNVASPYAKATIKSYPEPDDPELVKSFLSSMESGMTNALRKYEAAHAREENIQMRIDDIGHTIALHASEWIVPWMESMYAFGFGRSTQGNPGRSFEYNCYIKIVLKTYLDSFIPLIRE